MRLTKVQWQEWVKSLSSIRLRSIHDHLQTEIDIHQPLTPLDLHLYKITTQELDERYKR